MASMDRPESKALAPFKPVLLHLSSMPPSPPAASDTITLIQTRSLPTLVQQELERMIVAGELSSGAKLNEVAIAERLGVSRGPVREAFRALEESGLVRLEKNRGVFVRQVSLEEADEIFEVRATLEEWAGRRVAKRATTLEVRELQDLVERMERAAERGDVDAYVGLNLAFHDRLITLAGNAKLRTVYRRLVNELSLYRRASLRQSGALSISAREHRAIVEKIASRNAGAVAKALREHVMASKDRLHKAHQPAEALRRPGRASIAGSRRAR